MHFLVGLFLLCLGSVQGAVQSAAPAAAFLPGVRYVYGYSSSAALLEDLNFGVQGEVSVLVVGDSEEHTELLLTFADVSLTWTTTAGSYVDKTAIGDLTNWFSAIETESGSISEVHYPRNEAAAVTAFKKSVAELLSANSADAERELIGLNLVVREAVITQHGTWEKTTNKVTAYDTSGQLASIELEELTTGQLQQTAEPKGALLGFPIHSHTRVSLLRQLPDTMAPQRPARLVADSVHTTEFKEVVPLAKMKMHISERLACATEDPSSSCMQELVSLLRLLSGDDITTLAELHLQLSLPGSSKKQALVLIDALFMLGSPEITDVLMQYVLRSPQRNSDLVIRTLFHLTTAIQHNSKGTVARDVIDAVWELVFDSSVSTAMQQRALLTLGALAGVLRDPQPELAGEVVGSLHALLEGHTGIPAQAVTLTKSKRSLPSTLSHSYDPQLHAILIDSLGNAGAPESLPTLTHHLREEVGGEGRLPLSVRHAAVKALRGFRDEESASALLQAAEHSPHSSLSQLAARAYQTHPRRKRDLSHLLQPSNPPSFPSLRSRRQLDDNSILVSNVTMPTVSWNSVYGEQNISTDLGRRIMNSFQLESGPLSSRYKFSLHDEASFMANLLLSDGEQHSEMLRTELCLQGEADYDINILTGFTQNLTARQMIRYSAVVGNLTESFQAAYDELVASVPPYSGLSSSLNDALDGLQERFAGVDSILSQFQAELDSIETNFGLKLWAESIASTVTAVQSDARVIAQSSVEDISEAIDSVLPSRPQAVVSSLDVGTQPFTMSTFYLPYLPFAPQKAMANISSVLRSTDESFTELRSAVVNLQSMTDPNGPNRQWLSPGVSQIVGNDITALLEELNEAIDSAGKSPTQSYDGASISELVSLRQAVTSDLQPAVVTLDMVAAELLVEANQLDQAFDGTQDAFDAFTKAYERARSEIDTIFGQRFHPEFPRQLRSCDSAGSGCGTYPSTSDGRYRRGVDLRVEDGVQVVTPLTGYLQLLDPSTLSEPLSYGATSSLILVPAESSFNSIHFIITNLRLDPSIAPSDLQFFLSGDVIGYPDDSIQIAGETFIHVEAYKIVDGVEYAIDPMQFLQPNLDPQVGIQFECNDLVTYVGGMVVDRRPISPTELEPVMIGDPLVDGVPGHEFPQPHDLILRSEDSLTSAERVQFFQSSTFIMVGPIPVQFDFSSVGRYQLNFSLSSSFLSRSLEATMTPYLHARAEGTMRIGSTLFASVEIGGTIVETALPLRLGQEFGDWPLRASSVMDLVLAPSTLTLTSQLVQLTGAGEFADQEVLETQILWRYSIPPLNRDEFYYDGTLSDVSPPQFIPLPYAESNQSDCFVRQLPGRQYSSPAFELEYEIMERESVVNMTYRVGDFLTGENVISGTELGGKRIVIPAELLLATELFFTVSATNRNGLRSLASCLLPVYDRSPPMARINPIRPVSSHPSMIKALVALFDETGFEDSLEIAVGTVPGEYGNDVLSWQPFDVAQINTPPAENGDVMNLFSFPRTGRLIGGILMTVSGLPTVDACARQCADSISCRSYDYSLLESNCILHGNVEGPETPPNADYENVFYTPPLRISRSYSHYEKLGVGNSTVIEFSNLTFVHNTFYYINMRLRNRLGYTSTVTSSTFLVDLTTPTPGRIRNAVSDVLHVDGCSASVVISDERCIQESDIPNHRVIVDEPGSAVIFNGPTPLVDAMYTATTNYITANWNSFQDAESGLYAYTWCVGTSIGSCDLISSRDPHAHLASQEAWTNTGLASSQNLSDGTYMYYITVEAVNNAEYGSPLVTTVHHSTPYMVDTSSPLLTDVRVLNYTASSTELLLAYNASDPGSGIRSVSVALGRSELDTSIMEWVELGGGAGYEDSEIGVQVEVPSGVATWVKVRATNNAGLQTIMVAANSPLMVDLTPPLPGYIRDGMDGDIDYQSDASMLCINGDGFGDPESGIAEILWGIGTTPGASNVRGLTPLTPSEIARRVACISGLSLVINATYYSTFVVSNGAVNALSITVISDGVLIDISPPLPGSVFDGLIPQVSQEFSSSLTTVAANWDGFVDYESGISHYIITVFDQPSGSGASQPIYSERVDGTLNEVVLSRFGFSNADFISVQLEAVNQAGISTIVNSAGYIIDLTPTELTFIVDGSDSSSDLEYQADAEILSVSWDARDEESGISQIEGAVYELREGRRMRVYPDPLSSDATAEVIPETSTSWQVNTSLVSGSKYIAAVTFTNGAGLRTRYESNGVLVDTTPPLVESVSVLSDTYVDADSGGMVTAIANPNLLEIRWIAADPETGILEYLVGVVNDNLTLVTPYVSFGTATGGLIENLNFPPGGEYMVTLVAVNLAGLQSDPAFSEPFRVALGDSAGVIYDGEDPSFIDVDYTDELTAITAHFYGFFSQSCGGLSNYEWAVGGASSRESVLPFTDSGVVVVGTNGSGYAQVLLPDLDSYEDQSLYVTVRGITGCGDVLESTSNGFIIDPSPPSLEVISTGYRAIERAQSTDGDAPIDHEMYQETVQFSSVWQVGDEVTDDVMAKIGTYPGGADIANERAVSENYIRSSLTNVEGLPNYVTVSAQNGAGLESVVISDPVSLDTSPPTGGELICTAIGHPESTSVWLQDANTGFISCEWSGVSDLESDIVFYTITVGTSPSDQSLSSGNILAGNSNIFETPQFEFTTNTAYYVTLYATNSAGLEGVLIAPPVYFDTSPPVFQGSVRVLPNSISTNFTSLTELGEATANSVTAGCLLDSDLAMVLFEEATDPETEVDRYEISLGYSPGNADLRSFQRFEPALFAESTLYHLLTPLDFAAAERRAVYFSVKVCNSAGLCSFLSSGPVFIKSDLNMIPSWIYDGEDLISDIDYQISTTTIKGYFQIGANCPLASAQWAVESVDGMIVQDYVDINLEAEISGDAVDDTNTIFVTTDQVQLFDDETYRILLQAVDLSGEVYILRSNGTTVTTRSLLPGLVKDGPIIGQDLNHQESTTTLYAQWSGFGDGSPEQEIAYYEVGAGSYREFPNTRTNIAPFTNVGLNESHTFTDLDLIPQEVVYYVTVRAQSVSGAYIDVTSNGITVGFGHEIIPGRITVPQYQSDTANLSVYWREFESDLPIRSYEWALGSRLLTSEELDAFCTDAESNHSTAFEVFGFKYVDLDTAATATGLVLAHNTSYYVTIRAIDQAKKCLATQSFPGVLIDITAPEPRSGVTAGPPESLINILDDSEFVVYIQLPEMLDVTWEKFVDYESGVERYEVAVFEQTACGNNTLADDVTPIFDYMSVGTDLRVSFKGLNFVSGVSYVVEVRAINLAGLSNSIYSQPVVVDSAPLFPGTIKDGLNWESDLVFQSDLSTLSGVFTHAKLSPQYPGEVQQPGPCPETTFYDLSSLNSAWSRLEPTTVLGGLTAIVYAEAQIDVSIDPPGVEITAVRVRESEQIMSGTYQTSAQISNGGTVSLDILAAQGTPNFQAQAVTSVVFIDSGTVTDILAEFELDQLGSYEYPTSPEFSAFGLQIHHSRLNEANFEPQRVVMWATANDPLASPLYVVRELTADLSEIHTYTFDFQFEQLDVGYVRKVDLYIDGTLVSALQGLPSFSEDARIILHTFNRLGYVPPIENALDPLPEVVAVFANVTLPLRTSHLCDYGTPFFSEESPVVLFSAGAGTTPGALDVRGLELISLPCHPCLPSACPSYGCDPNCTIVDPDTIPFTFYNLSLSPGYYTNFSQSDSGDGEFEFEPTNQNEANMMISLLTDHFQPSVYYVTVHATSASGKTIYSVSNGVIIDTTPPEIISPIEHFDASFEFAQPTSFQGDDSTISARWTFHDPESGITEYLWAIGTTPYGQDIQAYESVGMATEATNTSLAGILEHNTTYYVTVMVTNGAGLSANTTSGGVTYIATELNRTDVEIFVQVESVAVLSVAGENGTQLLVLRVEEEDRASIAWEGVSEDVEEIFWSVGSETLSDDIFPRTEVGFNETTSATIDGGVLFIASTPFANVSEIIALAEGREEDIDDNSFFFEPGRLFYHSLELCNFVHRCVVVETNPSVVIRTKDSEALSVNGEDVTITTTQEIPDGVDPVDLPVLDRRHRVDIATSGGLEPGSRLFAGLLNDSDVTQRYRVSLPYITNPAETMVQTSRELARRFTEIGGPSFYVSFLGQDSLNGPLTINTTFDPSLDWSNANPDLGYWDIDEQVWREVNASCVNGSRVDWPTFTIAAQMCSTVLSSLGISRPESLTRRRRQVSLANDTSSGLGSGMVDIMEPVLDFLDRPTQFVVMRIGNFSTNTAPRLNLPAESIQITEDNSLTMYSLADFVEDAEGDAVDFYLASLPLLGDATLTLDGILTYTPCPNCIGMDILEVYIMERPFGINAEPLSDTGMLRFEIANLNDIPEILFYQDDTLNLGSEFDIITNHSISSFIDANRTSPVVVARVAAFDFDAYSDDLIIFVRDGDFGSAGYQVWLDAVNTPESLPANWLPGSLIDSFTGYVTFVAFNLTYLPDPNFVETDEISVLVRDSRGVFSDTITVSVEVLPSLCENNGVCAGSDADPDCSDIEARRGGFDGYNCSCLPGFGGQYCETLLGTPEPSPSRVCPEGIPILQCDGDPCGSAVCPSHPAAECRANFCGSCRAEWYEGDTLVQCNADDPSVCHSPNPNIFTNCGSVSCDCPSQPFPCPEDSILIETRRSDCCVSYECSCPNISCPLLMECGQGVQPIPSYRGNGFPGRCCPDYSYEDINECLAVSQNTCSDICVNEDFTYSCTCPASTTLAQDGVNCGVCVYNGMEYLYGDRVRIGCNWCICQSDSLSGERWHCTADTCDRGCILNGLFYPVESVAAEGAVTCTCVPTDTNAQWECLLEL